LHSSAVTPIDLRTPYSQMESLMFCFVEMSRRKNARKKERVDTNAVTSKKPTFICSAALL